MRATAVVNNLHEITPALFDVAGVPQPEPTGATRAALAADVAQLGYLGEVERSRVGSVIPRTPFVSAMRPFGEPPAGMNIIEVHQRLRSNAEKGLRALAHITEYRDELGVLERRRAGSAVRAFAGFAVVRMTQVEGYWRRGRDQEADHMEWHFDSYQTLKPFMPLGYRQLLAEVVRQNPHLKNQDNSAFSTHTFPHKLS